MAGASPASAPGQLAPRSTPLPPASALPSKWKHGPASPAAPWTVAPELLERGGCWLPAPSQADFGQVSSETPCIGQSHLCFLCHG